MAGYNGNGAFVLPRALRIKNGVNVETLAIARTLSLTDSMVQLLDNSTGGALDVTLPDYKEGAIFAIKSTGTAALTLKRQSSSVIGSLAAGEGALLVCTGSAASSDWVIVIKA
tara:strand:+ start:554 stop:892 length:339 start_codon:yes stop_codon:yes gene_type:complete